MRGILRAIGTAAMAVLASMSLVACGGSGSDEVVVVTVTSTPGVPLDVPQDQQQDQQGQSDSGVDLGKLRSAYEQVLAAPPDLDTLTHEDFEAFGGTYGYAIGEFTSDNRPDLLIRRDTRGWSPITMITTDADYNIVQATASLLDGASGHAGRGRMAFSSDGDGVFQILYDANATSGRSERYRLVGTMPTKVGEETVPLPNLPSTHIEVNWRPTTDPSGLDALSTVAAQYGQAQQLAQQATPEPAQAEGASQTDTIELSGTMRHLDRQGVLFGSADPNPGVDLANSFWVLMLDQSQDITGFQSGRPETTRTRTMDVGGEHYRG